MLFFVANGYNNNENADEDICNVSELDLGSWKVGLDGNAVDN